MNNRPLGRRQESCLAALKRQGRYPGGGWVWTSHSETVQILESLVKRGLVTTHQETLRPMGRTRYPKGHPYRDMTRTVYKPVVVSHVPDVNPGLRDDIRTQRKLETTTPGDGTMSRLLPGEDAMSLLRDTDELRDYLAKYAYALDRHVARARSGTRNKWTSRAAIRDQLNVMEGRLRMAFYAGIVDSGDDLYITIKAAIHNAENYVKDKG